MGTKTIPGAPAEFKQALHEAAQEALREQMRNAPIIGDAKSFRKMVALADYTPTKAKMVGKEIVVDGDSFPSKGLALPPIEQQASYELFDPLEGKGMRAAQYVKVVTLAALNAKTGMGGDVKELAKSLRKSGKIDAFVEKALLEGTILDGGIFVPPEFSNELIPLLRNATVLLESGIRSVSMGGDQLVYGRQNAPATGYYVGEVFVTTYSQAQTGQLVLKTKKLKAITAISDELLRDAGAAADEFIRDDLVRVLALRMDLAGMTGDGTTETPLGLRYATASANIAGATQAGSAATFQEIAGDIGSMKAMLRTANIPKDGWAWLMSPRSRTYLETVSSSFGIFPFRDEVNAGKLSGAPVFDTAAIADNGGGGGNESTVFLLAAPQYLFGVREGIIVQAFPGGAFNDSTGNIVSGISTGQTPIVAEMRHDFALRYTKACAIRTGVKWGA